MVSEGKQMRSYDSFKVLVDDPATNPCLGFRSTPLP